MRNAYVFKFAFTVLMLFVMTKNSIHCDWHDICIVRGILLFFFICLSNSWAAHAPLNRDDCSFIVDFNVPGKPNPPPVTFTATIWTQSHLLPNNTAEEKYMIEFTDPSGTLAPPSVLLNAWVQRENFFKRIRHSRVSKECIAGTPLHFKDVREGYDTLVTLRGKEVNITSWKSNNKRC